MKLISIIIGVVLSCISTAQTKEPTTFTTVDYNNRDISVLESIVLETHAEEVNNIHIEPIISVEKDNELQLMARVVYGEAGNQDEMGKRLVIDCILNRIDKGFGDTITEVLYAPGQFDAVYYINNYPISEDIYNLILEEMDNRTNTEVLYFRPNHYHNFGTPVMQHQDHYFSK